MELRVAVCLAFFLLLSSAKAVSSELRFGFTGPLTGPNALAGEQIVRGLELGFKRINDSKQLNYTLSLIPLDDGYEPSRTPGQVTKLIQDYGVKAMIGSVGTPTNLASLSLLAKYGIPLITPLTGAQSLRVKRESPFIFNTRASYKDEASFLITLLVNYFDIKPSEIAIFAQKDSYGDAGVASTMEALLANGLTDSTSILQIRHQRNNNDVTHSVADVLGVFPTPKAIVLISTYETSAHFIKLLEDFGVSPFFAAFSFTGIEALQTQTINTQSNVIMAQTTPPLSDSHFPIVQQMKEDMERAGDTAPPTTIQLEGYLNALIVGRALMTLKDLPTSQDIEDSLKQLSQAHYDTEEDSELSVFNPNKRRIWAQYMTGGELQKTLFTNFIANKY